LAAGATQFVTYAILNFTTLFLMREKGMSLDQLAIWYALLIGLAVPVGMYLSGRLIDLLAPRMPQIFALLPGAALAMAVPFFLGFVAAPRWPLALVLLTGPMFFNYFYLTPAIALVQKTVPANQRTLAGAVSS
jgi:predicted MFS family arabinose efflux permease